MKKNYKFVVELTEREVEKFERVTFSLYEKNKITRPKKSLALREFLISHLYTQLEKEL